MLSVLSIFESVEALLLPQQCLGCERGVAAGADPLCDQCRLSLRPLSPPRCPRCGQTLDRWDAGRQDGKTARCGFCREWPVALAWADSAAWFDDGAARELVHALKYAGWRVAARPMARVMARRLGRSLAGAALVPVPLGRVRLRERGHNQAELLAAALGAELGLAVAADALERARETRTQTSLHPAERRANVRGAFRARGVTGERVVLVDDVLTTGATLGAAAEALAAAGAASVGAVTFARATKPQ